MRRCKQEISRYNPGSKPAVHPTPPIFWTLFLTEIEGRASPYSFLAHDKYPYDDFFQNNIIIWFKIIFENGEGLDVSEPWILRGRVNCLLTTRY